MRKELKAIEQSAGRRPEDKKEEYLKDIPMKRFGTAEEIGDVVTMLAGPACSYMTGQVIVLDGGLSL